MLHRLPDLCANGALQMRRDRELLERHDDTILLRRYTWRPAALSLGRFQRLAPLPHDLPFDVVRRPSGGRGLLHGAEFEWSFALAGPAASLTRGEHGPLAAFLLVRSALIGALRRLDVPAGTPALASYRGSALCLNIASSSDVVVDGRKVAALAQVRLRDRVLVHGSLRLRRPPAELRAGLATVLGAEEVDGGLADCGYNVSPDELWRLLALELETRSRRAA